MWGMGANPSAGPLLTLCGYPSAAAPTGRSAAKGRGFMEGECADPPPFGGLRLLTRYPAQRPLSNKGCIPAKAPPPESHQFSNLDKRLDPPIYI
jgi:hypothetical protein